VSGVSRLTGTTNYFEDFYVGRKIRHYRGATIDEVENSLLSKQVMNTAQGHWNEEYLTGSMLGDGRLVFGLITGSVVVGLASQDTSDNALADLRLDGVKFQQPVHHGDTIYAFSEVLAVAPSADRTDAGEVAFQHSGVNQHGELVCQLTRTVLVKRRIHWAASSAERTHG
jgi:itaconyl-CoA hydratase